MTTTMQTETEKAIRRLSPASRTLRGLPRFPGGKPRRPLTAEDRAFVKALLALRAEVL